LEHFEARLGVMLSTTTTIVGGGDAVDEAAVLACVAVPLNVLTSYSTDTPTVTATAATPNMHAQGQVQGLVSAFLGVSLSER
jgi:hypothetical protein